MIFQFVIGQVATPEFPPRTYDLSSEITRVARHQTATRDYTPSQVSDPKVFPGCHAASVPARATISQSPYWGAYTCADGSRADASCACYLSQEQSDTQQPQT